MEVGDSPVLSMCVVRDKVWMGFEIGYLMMFETNTKRPYVQVRELIDLWCHTIGHNYNSTLYLIH